MNIFRKFVNFNVSRNFKNVLYSTGSNRPKELVFFDEKVQNILKQITDKDYSIVFRRRKDAERYEPPQFKFMTQEDYEKELKIAEEKSDAMLQMPPVVPPRKDVSHVFDKDERLVGYCQSKFVFTDITYGKTDKNRCIVVRDPDGTLRKADWEERSRMNEIYFPREGRQLRNPEMFEPKYMMPLLEKEEYLFILDKACIQFDPDDPTYINIRNLTFEDINEKGNFLKLRSTRHFGPLAFYLALNDKIGNLLTTFINTERLDFAVKLIQMYFLVHPEKDLKINLTPGQELDYVQEFSEKVYPNEAKLHESLKKYRKLVHKPQNEAVV